MKLKEFIKNLEIAYKQDPSILELDVIAAKDDEGNGFNFVHDYLTKGHFDGEYNGEFYSEKNIIEDPDEYDNLEINAICIN